MQNPGVIVLRGEEVLSLLEGRDLELVGIVRAAYEAHAQGEGSLPNSSFLLFPQDSRNRIIALPAYLGNGDGVAGIKWIASFPGNHDLGLERASATLILNSVLTGLPLAIMEGSVISARRTAASAALAAQWLQRGRRTDSAGLFGCGLINFEIARFLLQIFPELKGFTLYDKSREHASLFKRKVERLAQGLDVEIVDDGRELLRRSPLTSFATTASTPHIEDLSVLPPGATILHISLRDLTPEAILSADNVVDDVEHACRAQTSVHLAEQLSGQRDFIRCTLADITSGAAPPRRDADSPIIFSPFGLGILDISVGKLVYELALAQDKGTLIESFLPEPWMQRGSFSLKNT